MSRAVIERTDPPQRRDGDCLYELWLLDGQGRKLTRRGSVPVTFRGGNPDATGAQVAKSELHAIALAEELDVVRETR